MSNQGCDSCTDQTSCCWAEDVEGRGSFASQDNVSEVGLVKAAGSDWWWSKHRARQLHVPFGPPPEDQGGWWALASFLVVLERNI